MRKICNLLIFNVIFFTCFVVARPAFAAEISDQEQLVDFLNNIHTMQADFEQFMVNKSGVKIGQQTAGTMALQRPGKFRWQMNEPSNQTIVVDKNRVTIYDEDLAQVTKRKMDYHQPGNPAMLLSGTVENLEDQFIIKKLAKPGSGTWFELRPKAKNNMYQWVKLYFVDGELDAMYISDNLGQQSEIHFDNIILNQDLAKDTFKLELPKGVDQVEL